MRARMMGCAILTQTMERRHHLGLDSYDRFFPSQDTVPKGGFGNLIALPLQWMPRQKDNSVFVDDSFHPLQKTSLGPCRRRRERRRRQCRVRSRSALNWSRATL
jgi:hypothetical protein